MTYSITPARGSELSPFPFKFVLVDISRIGTSEQIRWQANVDSIERSIVATGYAGPPIAVYQALNDELFAKTVNGHRLGGIRFGDLGVADGHHRLEALSRLNQKHALKTNVLPVLLIPAHDAGKIRLATIHDDEAPLSLSELAAPFTHPQQFIPLTTTTHFEVRLRDGNWVRIFDALPDLVIRPADLLASTR